MEFVAGCSFSGVGSIKVVSKKKEKKENGIRELNKENGKGELGSELGGDHRELASEGGGGGGVVRTWGFVQWETPGLGSQGTARVSYLRTGAVLL